tara:strand:+ start:642 stop:1034 length:393 start_codon:yes stop_codon:yes gene_type:complete
MSMKITRAALLAALVLAGQAQAQGVGGALGDAMQRFGAQMYDHAAQRELLERQHQMEMERLRAQQAQPAAPGFPQLDAAHPGWKSTVQSPDFSAWMGRQPASVQALASSNREADAILILDLFKRDQAAGR